MDNPHPPPGSDGTSPSLSRPQGNAKISLNSSETKPMTQHDTLSLSQPFHPGFNAEMNQTRRDNTISHSRPDINFQTHTNDGEAMSAGQALEHPMQQNPDVMGEWINSLSYEDGRHDGMTDFHGIETSLVDRHNRNPFSSSAPQDPAMNLQYADRSLYSETATDALLMKHAYEDFSQFIFDSSTIDTYRLDQTPENSATSLCQQPLEMNQTLRAMNSSPLPVAQATEKSHPESEIRTPSLIPAHPVTGRSAVWDARRYLSTTDIISGPRAGLPNNANSFGNQLLRGPDSMINPRNAGPSSTRHARTGRNALPSSSPQAPETGFDNLVWETSTPQIPIPLSFQNSYGLETPPVGIMESGGRQWHLSTDTPRPRSAPPSNAGHLRGLANQMPPNPYVRMLQQPRRTSSTPSFRPTVDTSPYPNDAGQASTLSSTSSSALTNSHASSSSTTPSCIIPPSLIMDPIPKYNPPLQSVSVPPGLDTRLPGPLDPRNNTPSPHTSIYPTSQPGLPTDDVTHTPPDSSDPHTLKRQRPVSSSSIVSDIPSASFARRRGSTNSIDVEVPPKLGEGEEEEDEDFVDEEDGGGGVASGATSGTSGTPKNDVGEKSKDEKDLIRRKRNTEAAKRSRERKNARISQLEAVMKDLERENSNLRIRAAVLQNDKTALQMRERELITRVSVLETQLAEVHRSMHEVAMRYHALQQGMTSVGYEESGESGESGASQLRGNDGGDEVEEDIIEKDREFGKDENPN